MEGEQSTKYPEASIEDYAQNTRATVDAWKLMNGLQGGDPAKLADVPVQLAGRGEPPARFAAGTDALQAFEAKAKALLTQAEADRTQSSSLSYAGA